MEEDKRDEGTKVVDMCAAVDGFLAEGRTRKALRKEEGGAGATIDYCLIIAR